jgi:hypothetical protein
MQLFTKLNQWYDRLPEPRRFLTMLAITMPGIFLMGFDLDVKVRFAGFVYLTGLVLARIWWLGRTRR